MIYRGFTTIYLLSLSLMIWVGLAYESLSPGLASPELAGPLYCKELFSSGSDDDGMIGAFALFSLPFALRLFRIDRAVTSFEIAALFFCVTMTIIALWLASLDCASIFYTAFVLPDLPLGSALVSLPVSVVSICLLHDQTKKLDTSAW
ncbi:hypothetical protein O206_19700 [Ochrobactrum sp. EGD-AQ16]|nr:hypothetical protein O206_19700 [Ochrobactrum sp. EGD-AQ16]